MLNQDEVITIVMGSWILHSIGHLGDGRMWMVKHPMVTEPFQPPVSRVHMSVLSTCMIFKKRKRSTFSFFLTLFGVEKFYNHKLSHVSF